MTYRCRAAGESSIHQTDFQQNPIDYASEFAYWDAVQSAIGTEIPLTPDTDRTGAFRRVLSTDNDTTVVALADLRAEGCGLEDAAPGVCVTFATP